MRRWVVGAVLAEAVVAAGYGVYLGIETVVAPATDRLAAAFLALLALVLAAGLVVLARAVAA
jgi:hypothetical protein